VVDKKAMVELLRRCVTPSELVHLVLRADSTGSLREALPASPGTVSAAELLHLVADATIRHGVAEGLLRELAATKPEQSQHIATLASKWGLDIEKDGLQMTGLRQLTNLRAMREAAVAANEDTSELDSAILELHRRLRTGPVLGNGDTLGHGRYRVVSAVGEGGWGTVYQAYDRETGESVALKVLHARRAHNRSDRERFARGARQMDRLRHPGIVGVRQQMTEEHGLFFIVMDFIEGSDLQKAHSEVAVPSAIEILASIADALAYAHDRDIVHRDGWH
jgi:hypothetical protein